VAFPLLSLDDPVETDSSAHSVKKEARVACRGPICVTERQRIYEKRLLFRY